MLDQHEGEFSYPLACDSFDFCSRAVRETKEFCRNRGYEIDRISFVVLYDADLAVPTEFIKTKSDLLLKIVERQDGKVEACIFISSQTECE